MYEDAMRGVHAHLIFRTRLNMTYTSVAVSFPLELRLIWRAGTGCSLLNKITLSVSSPVPSCLVR